MDDKRSPAKKKIRELQSIPESDEEDNGNRAQPEGIGGVCASPAPSSWISSASTSQEGPRPGSAESPQTQEPPQIIITPPPGQEPKAAVGEGSTSSVKTTEVRSVSTIIKHNILCTQTMKVKKRKPRLKAQSSSREAQTERIPNYSATVPTSPGVTIKRTASSDEEDSPHGEPEASPTKRGALTSDNLRRHTEFHRTQDSTQQWVSEGLVSGVTITPRKMSYTQPPHPFNFVVLNDSTDQDVPQHNLVRSQRATSGSAASTSKAVWKSSRTPMLSPVTEVSKETSQQASMVSTLKSDSQIQERSQPSTDDETEVAKEMDVGEKSSEHLPSTSHEEEPGSLDQTDFEDDRISLFSQHFALHCGINVEADESDEEPSGQQVTDASTESKARLFYAQTYGFPSILLDDSYSMSEDDSPSRQSPIRGGGSSQRSPHRLHTDDRREERPRLSRNIFHTSVTSLDNDWSGSASMRSIVPKAPTASQRTVIAQQSSKEVPGQTEGGDKNDETKEDEISKTKDDGGDKTKDAEGGSGRASTAEEEVDVRGIMYMGGRKHEDRRGAIDLTAARSIYEDRGLMPVRDEGAAAGKGGETDAVGGAKHHERRGAVDLTAAKQILDERGVTLDKDGVIRQAAEAEQGAGSEQDVPSSMYRGRRGGVDLTACMAIFKEQEREEELKKEEARERERAQAGDSTCVATGGGHQPISVNITYTPRQITGRRYAVDEEQRMDIDDSETDRGQLSDQSPEGDVGRTASAGETEEEGGAEREDTPAVDTHDSANKPSEKLLQQGLELVSQERQATSGSSEVCHSGSSGVCHSGSSGENESFRGTAASGTGIPVELQQLDEGHTDLTAEEIMEMETMYQSQDQSIKALTARAAAGGLEDRESTTHSAHQSSDEVDLSAAERIESRAATEDQDEPSTHEAAKNPERGERSTVFVSHRPDLATAPNVARGLGPSKIRVLSLHERMARVRDLRQKPPQMFPAPPSIPSGRSRMVGHLHAQGRGVQRAKRPAYLPAVSGGKFTPQSVSAALAAAIKKPESGIAVLPPIRAKNPSGITVRRLPAATATIPATDVQGQRVPGASASITDEQPQSARTVLQGERSSTVLPPINPNPERTAGEHRDLKRSERPSQDNQQQSDELTVQADQSEDSQGLRIVEDADESVVENPDERSPPKKTSKK